ncbi:MAG: mechanosensitive ion channel family protein [Chlamydiales bacterium]|nr:mechanosensitive ion channel family protein [Chlamydiales bacterium]
MLDSLMQHSHSVWFWALQVFAVIFTSLLFDFGQRKILQRAHLRLEKSNIWTDAVLKAAILPFSVIIWMLGISFSVQIIEHASNILILSAIIPIKKIGIVAAVAWFFLRVAKNIENNVARSKAHNVDRTTADAIGKIVRLSIFITAALVGMQTLGINTSGILAVGGMGTIALGFASKDLLANFFGALMVYWDRPFKVGEWIRSPDKEIEGYVESIGWRLTKIRTFEKRILYVPNSVFSTISVENPSRMSNRRIKEMIGVRYDDIKHVPSIVADIKQMLIDDDRIDKNMVMIVNLAEFGPSSLDILVYTFTKTTKWVEFHGIKQEVLLRIAEIIEKYGAEMAFPTQTLHLPDHELTIPQFKLEKGELRPATDKK